MLEKRREKGVPCTRMQARFVATLKGELEGDCFTPPVYPAAWKGCVDSDCLSLHTRVVRKERCKF